MDLLAARSSWGNNASFHRNHAEVPWAAPVPVYLGFGLPVAYGSGWISSNKSIRNASLGFREKHASERNLSERELIFRFEAQREISQDQPRMGRHDCFGTNCSTRVSMALSENGFSKQ